MDDAIRRIGEYRDRHSRWGLVIGFIAVVLGSWTTAPTLDVQIPLVGGTKVGFNVGYVLSVGMPLLVISMAWVMMPLFAMRRMQNALIEELSANGKSLSSTQQTEFLGPLSTMNVESRWQSGVLKLLAGTRYFVLFVCPLIGILWIGEEYFFQLQAYDRESSVSSLMSAVEKERSTQNAPDWRIPNKKSELSFADYFFRSKPKTADGNMLKYFTVSNRDLERNCAQIWVRDALADQLTNSESPAAWKVRVTRTLEKKTDNLKCVVEAFPRFELALNSWVNLLALIGSFWLAVAGWLAFRTTELRQQLDALRDD